MRLSAVGSKNELRIIAPSPARDDGHIKPPRAPVAQSIRPPPASVRRRRRRLHDIQMDPAASGAALGPVFGAGAATEYTQDGELAMAFRAFGAHDWRGRRSLHDFKVRHGRPRMSEEWLDVAFVVSRLGPEISGTVDLLLGIGDGRFTVGPGEADFHFWK
jgi:hypothetical protein